jgi:hypothetical protein
MRFQQRLAPWALALVAATLAWPLAGCGGGGGSAPAPTYSDPVTSASSENHRLSLPVSVGGTHTASSTAFLLRGALSVAPAGKAAGAAGTVTVGPLATSN